MLKERFALWCKPALLLSMTFEIFDDPDKAIRHRWGKNLTEVMGTVGMKPKSLVIALAGVGCEVSTQSVSQWMSGAVAPKPSVMVAIAKVLMIPPRVLFSLDVEFVTTTTADAA